ncbi:MAG: endonuclease/exonuclease/phosphatase family protein [Ilumatobacter sp.]
MSPATRRRVFEATGWLVTASVGLVLLTQTLGWEGGTLIAVLQALTPIGLVAAIAVAAIAALSRSHLLALGSGAVVVGLLVLSIPLAFPADRLEPGDGAVGVSVASVNILFDNRQVIELGADLAERSPDVIAFSEFIQWHRRTLRVNGLRAQYPHRIDVDPQLGSGMSIWSKYPIVDWEVADPNGRIVDATIDGPDGVFRLLSVHPRTPIHDFALWIETLGEIARLAADDDSPTLVVGDFNASYWHPAYREILDNGLVDAHIATRDPWSTSWPTDRLIPPFVRLDHALVDDRLAVIDLVDFQPPGSDHRGFVVTVAPASVS